LPECKVPPLYSRITFATFFDFFTWLSSPTRYDAETSTSDTH
jgi:hypothetical protein